MAPSDKVRCKLCLKWFRTLRAGHLRVHGMSTTDYAMRFPRASMGLSSIGRFRSKADGATLREFNRKRVKALRSRDKAAKAETSRKQSAAHKQRYANMDASEREALSHAIGKSHRERLAAMTPKELQAEHTKRSRVASVCQRKRFAAMDEAELREFLSKTYTGSTSKTEARMVRTLKALGHEVKAGHKIHRFVVDAYLPEKKLVIEMFGDYWHGSPALFKATDFHPSTKQCVAEIRKRDKSRVKQIEALGYRVRIVWESELKEGGFKRTLRSILAAHDNTEPRPSRKGRKA